jgi:UDP-N-acetylglucosamine transferase subunit ALG13
MIFLTVGTQLPFDRLVSAVDTWAAQNGSEVVAQIGNSGLRPDHLRWTRFMGAPEFRECFHAADAIVAHAGMGTILTGLDLGKPVVIVPRLAAHGEHRNDHQLATVEQLSRFPLVRPVHDVAQLGTALDDLETPARDVRSAGAESTGLLEAIRTFVTEGPIAPWPQAA